jgi:hypothetical protein
LYAGQDNSITVCNNASPFDLTEEIGGNPDPGGTWSPTLASGGNIYDPAIDGSGSFTYTVSSSDCPSDAAIVTVDVITCSIPQCEIPGYTYGGNYDGHSYYVSDANVPWNDAKVLALSIGGHLATISSTGENTFVTEVAALSNDFLVWIGLTDEDVWKETIVWVIWRAPCYIQIGSLWATPMLRAGATKIYTMNSLLHVGSRFTVHGIDWYMEIVI